MERKCESSHLKYRKNSPKERREALADILNNNHLDLALISNPKHIFYFTGFPSNLNMYLTLMKGPRSTSFLAVKSNGTSYILLGQSEAAASWNNSKRRNSLERIFDGEISTYTDYDPKERIVTYGDVLSIEFSNWLKGLGSSRKVGIEEWHLADSYRGMISKILDPQYSGLSQKILSMRATKGRDEIENVKSATKMIDFAYEQARLVAKPGNTELDIYAEMNYRTFPKYGPFGWIIGDHVSGERSLQAAGWASERVLKTGDTVILDLQASHNNYWSDLCRTFVVGRKSTKEQARVLATLSRSLERAGELMAPGVKVKDICSEVNQEITMAGYPKVPHHLGHSIGLDDQEPPWFLPNSEEQLEERMVCVVEPGIYIKEAGGVRIEDAYVITRKGNEKISHYALDLD